MASTVKKSLLPSVLLWWIKLKDSLKIQVALWTAAFHSVAC